MLRVHNGRILSPQGLQNGELWCDKGKIVSPQSAYEQAIDARGLIVAPGYIDMQINGAYGIDFASSPEKIGEVARKLPLQGVTSFLPTIVSSPRNKYPRLINMLQPRPISQGASILGIHLEGPFLHPDYRGAHKQEHLAALTEDVDVHAFYGSLKGVKLVTLAPELPFMLEAIAQLASQKIVCALGHSSASLDVVQKAIQQGASLVTHLFNGMQTFHHRHPSLVDAALISPGMNYTLICDGAHLSEQAVKIAWKLNPGGLILISDAIEGMGLSSGVRKLGDQTVEIRDSGAYVMGTKTLAGSVVGLDAAVRKFRAITGCSIQQAIESATLRPAKLLGLSESKGTLKTGADADFIFLDDNLNLRAVYALGRRVL